MVAVMKHRDDGGFEVGEAECVHDSGKALKCRIDGVGEEWVPQSQIHDDSEVYGNGDRGTLVVSTWYAEQKGWL